MSRRAFNGLVVSGTGAVLMALLTGCSLTRNRNADPYQITGTVPEDLRPLHFGDMLGPELADDASGRIAERLQVSMRDSALQLSRFIVDDYEALHRGRRNPDRLVIATGSTRGQDNHRVFEFSSTHLPTGWKTTASFGLTPDNRPDLANLEAVRVELLADQIDGPRRIVAVDSLDHTTDGRRSWSVLVTNPQQAEWFIQPPMIAHSKGQLASMETQTMAVVSQALVHERPPGIEQ